MSARHLVQAIYAFLIILWPTLTFAAASTFGATFEGVGSAAWVMVVVLSTVAGLTALLNRVNVEIQAAHAADRKLPPLRLFVAANLFGSWLTGLMAFLVCEHFDIPDFLEAAVVIGASYVGARLIERTMEGVVDRMLDKLSLILGGGNSRSRYDDRPSRFPEDRDFDDRGRGRF